MKKVALIVAGGRGDRMNSEIPKQFLLLNNLPILMHTIKQFLHFEEIIVVLPKSQFDCWNKLCKENNFNENHISLEYQNYMQSVKLHSEMLFYMAKQQHQNKKNIFQLLHLEYIYQ